MTPEPELDRQYVIQYLIDSIACNECGSEYAAHNIYVISQEDNTWTLMVTCPHCGSESVVMAYLDEMDDDALLPPDEGEITAWRFFLSHFAGDLNDLLTYG